MNQKLKTSEKETGKDSALDLPSMLAYLYKPVLPYLKNIKIRRVGPRKHNPADILLPKGYRAEVVATELNAPVHISFDNAGFAYVTESGHKIDSPPRIVKVDTIRKTQETFFTLPEDRWVMSGAMTGTCWHDGYLYFTNTDTLSRLSASGQVEDIVTGLPGRGDHQTNHPVMGPDGKIYFGQGCVTNCGVVGGDNAAFEWLPKFPQVCDVPARDIHLAGQNYEYHNVLGDVREVVRSGAFVPFGVETQPGQVIPGNVKASGAILRCNPDGSDLEVVAWGLRNPYGLAFDERGQLYVTEHGMDERGQRYILGDPDDFYEIHEGEWYGWPDFASGIRLDDPHWGEGGQGREPVLAEFPNPNPPRPLVSFQPHAAANGFAFSRDERFGFLGDAFVACFGDVAPITTARLAQPSGFKVVRVDMQNHRVEDFAVNKIAGPASKLPHGGFERPSHAAFGPDGSLYVVDFGEIELAAEKGGIRQQVGTGTLWRIARRDEETGETPPEPMVVPLYALQALAVLAGLVGFVALAVWGLRRLRSGGRRKRR